MFSLYLVNFSFHHYFISSFFFFRKKNTYCCRARRLSVRPSVCVNNFIRGNLISNRPIDPKIGLNVGYGVVHVRDMGKFSQIIFRSTSENSEETHQNYFLFQIFSSLRAIISEIKYFKL